MDDSNITIRVTGKGIDEVRQKMEQLGGVMQKVTISANGTYAASGKLKTAVDAQAGATKKAAAAAYLEEQATKAQSKSKLQYIGHIAKTTVLSAAINKLFLEFVDVAGQAVTAVDLMANFPATMASMGQSTKDATVAMDALRKYVGQVGGNIEQATSMVTRFTGVTKDVKAATAVYTGLNNALIAGDSSAEEQKQALLQFAQAFERGKPDMREWNSLTQNMSFQLQQVAQKMGYVNANALGAALRDGEESMGAFTATLTEMATGTGPIAQQAMTRMQGMQFAFNVMKNTLVTGMATIIQTLGRNNIVSFFTFATQVVLAFTKGIVWAINAVLSFASAISQLLGGPAIGGMKSDAEGVAAGLAAGAAGANDLGDGLKDAKDDAKELNKSLAGFDKMNVLPDKTSGKDKKDDSAGTGTVFNADELGKLSNAFGDITSKIGEIGLAAKVLAGILAGLAGALGIKKILDAFNDWNNTIKETKKNLGILREEEEKESKKKGGADDDKDASKSGKKAGSSFSNGFMSGIGGLIAGASRFLWVGVAAIFAPIGTAVATMFVGAAAAATLPLWGIVAIGVLVVAAIVALAWVIYKNWDKIWGFIKDVADAAWQGIQKGWDGIVDFFVDLWHGIQDVWDGVTDFFVNLWHGVYKVFAAVWSFLKEWGLTILAIIFFPFTLAVALIIAVVSGLVLVFQLVWEGIKKVFSVVAGFFGNIFQSAWDVITVVWEVAVAFFQAIWDGIVDIFTVVAEWFKDVFTRAWQGITAIWGLVSDWFNTNVIQPIIVFFTPLLNFLKNLFRDAWEGIKVIWNAVSGFFQGVWNGITGIFSGVGGWFGGVFQDAWNRVTGIFSGLWSWFRDNVWNRIVSLFSGIGTSVGDAIGNAFRGIVNTVLKAVSGVWNGFISIFNGAADIINKVSPVKIKTLGRWDVPQLARGGVATSPMIAQIGENGDEAVVPLERNTEWIDKLAAKINTATGASDDGRPVQLIVQIGEDRIMNKVINLINEKTQMSGRNQVIV